ncbi:UNVERIFIED_CONTAM: hypothetical protein FKN15_067808 [Acipenser sinensis]
MNSSSTEADNVSTAFIKNFIVVFLWFFINSVNGTLVVTFFKHRVFYENPRYMLFIHMHSYREVGSLLLYLAVGVSVFSGMAYTAEYEEEVGLDTIPACWWWGTVSMTTVGYGDVVPVTVAGKLAASGCILGGILVVALPITIIFNKFSHFYRKQKALEASVRNGHRKPLELGEGESEAEEMEMESQGLEEEEEGDD